MEIYKKHFGKKLKEALLAAGLKQIDLANELDMNASSVSQWISGKDFPEESRLPEICRIVNVSESYFIRDEKDEMSANELLSLLQENQDVIYLVPKIPKDILKMLARQNDTYFASLRRTLEGLEEKRDPKAKPKKSEA